MTLSFSRNQTKYSSFQASLFQQIQRDAVANMNQQYLRPIVNLKEGMTKVENQGKLNSCVAEAVAGALEYLIKRDYGRDSSGQEIDVSRMFIIWVGSMIEKESLEDQNNEGTWTPEAIYGVVKYGFCDERLWPPSAYTRSARPPRSVFKESQKYTIVPLLVPPNLNSMRRCLNYDLPFIIGVEIPLFHLPDMLRVNRYYNHSGRIPQQVGRHAVLVVGYNDHTQLFLVRNSWGVNWGFEGYFYIPYRYMVDRRFMAHDENGIWAIVQRHSKIITRSTTECTIVAKMKRRDSFSNPPKDPNPNNQFVTLPTESVDLKHWEMMRFAMFSFKSGLMNEQDLHNSTLLFEKYKQYLALRRYTKKLKHLLETD